MYRSEKDVCQSCYSTNSQKKKQKKGSWGVSTIGPFRGAADVRALYDYDTYKDE